MAWLIREAQAARDHGRIGLWHAKRVRGNDCEAGAGGGRDEVGCGARAHKSIGIEAERRLRRLVREAGQIPDEALGDAAEVGERRQTDHTIGGKVGVGSHRDVDRVDWVAETCGDELTGELRVARTRVVADGPADGLATLSGAHHRLAIAAATTLEFGTLSKLPPESVRATTPVDTIVTRHPPVDPCEGASHQ